MRDNYRVQINAIVASAISDTFDPAEIARQADAVGTAAEKDRTRARQRRKRLVQLRTRIAQIASAVSAHGDVVSAVEALVRERDDFKASIDCLRRDQERSHAQAETLFAVQKALAALGYSGEQVEFCDQIHKLARDKDAERDDLESTLLTRVAEMKHERDEALTALERAQAAATVSDPPRGDGVDGLISGGQVRNQLHRFPGGAETMDLVLEALRQRDALLDALLSMGGAKIPEPRAWKSPGYLSTAKLAVVMALYSRAGHKAKVGSGGGVLVGGAVVGTGHTVQSLAHDGVLSSWPRHGCETRLTPVGRMIAEAYRAGRGERRDA